MRRLSGAIHSILHGEGRVVMFLVLCVLLAEGGMRMIEKQLSKDIEHIRSLPEVARKMRDHDGKKVLFIGNSLTRCSIVPDILREQMVRSGAHNPALFFFIPDATSAGNWDYGFRRYFLNAGAVPDEVFIGTGPRHLADRTGGDASRLGAFYVPQDQIVRAMRQDVPGWEQKCEFMLARFSILYASRSKVKPRVFGPMIPDYFDMEQWVNDQRNSGSREESTAADSFLHLDALLELLQREKVSAHVFTIPQPKHYDLDDEARNIIGARGARLHHLANLPSISITHFNDGYHLDAKGAEIFSHALAKESP